MTVFEWKTEKMVEIAKIVEIVGINVIKMGFGMCPCSFHSAETSKC